MSLFLYIILFSFLSGVLSLLGGIVLLGNKNLVKKFSIHFISFAAGTLLATAFVDLLPEAIGLVDSGKVRLLFLISLFSIVVFFILEQILSHFHNHCFEVDHSGHNHSTPILLNIGDSLHNFIDGVIIAGAFITSIPLGIITSIAIASHELPQEISDFSIMLDNGWRRKKVLLVNILVSLTNVVGSIFTYILRDSIEAYIPYIISATAGIFIYIAATDLIPQITAKKPDKPAHVIILLLIGILSIWFVTNIFHV